MNRTNLRFSAIVALMLIIGLLFAGCQAVPAAGPGSDQGAAGASEQAAKLVIASFYPVDQVSGWQGLVDSFTAKHPGVTIEVQVTPFDQYMPKLLSQIAAF